MEDFKKIDDQYAEQIQRERIDREVLLRDKRRLEKQLQQINEQLKVWD